MKEIELMLLTTREMAASVGVTTRTIQNWVREGMISYFKIGKLIRFDPKRVSQDLEVFEISAKSGRPVKDCRVDDSQCPNNSGLCCGRSDCLDETVEGEGAERS